MSKDYHERANEWLTPSREEQLALILQGKCPHNQGWRYDGHGHNEEAYVCRMCGQLEWY